MQVKFYWLYHAANGFAVMLQSYCCGCGDGYVSKGTAFMAIYLTRFCITTPITWHKYSHQLNLLASPNMRSSRIITRSFIDNIYNLKLLFCWVMNQYGTRVLLAKEYWISAYCMGEKRTRRIIHAVICKNLGGAMTYVKKK